LQGSYGDILSSLKKYRGRGWKYLKTISTDNYAHIMKKYRDNKNKSPKAPEKVGRKPFLFPFEQIILHFFILLCIEDIKFPKKSELVEIFNKILQLKPFQRKINTKYVSYWLIKHGYSFRCLRKHNKEQKNSDCSRNRINKYFLNLYSKIYEGIDEKTGTTIFKSLLKIAESPSE
jgi:hypothetical protein